MKGILCFLLLIVLPLQASKGIIVACNDRYVSYLIPSIAYLRSELCCTLPIEVWSSGDELSLANKKRLSQLGGITFKDISNVFGPPIESYRGWHIKAYMLAATRFEEVILMDSDVYFYENPAVLFAHPEYKRTGAFFFRDRDIWRSPSEVNSMEKYYQRRDFFRSHIATPSPCIPKEWEVWWSEEIPSNKNRLLMDGQEAGCLAIDRERHKNGIREILQLNIDRSITYQCVFGDKETYWVGLEKAHEPYYVNSELPYTLKSKLSSKIYEKSVTIVQFLDGRLFYQQKHPIKVGKKSYFFNEHSSRSLTKEEILKINGLAEKRES